jgi:hypothetical protein
MLKRTHSLSGRRHPGQVRTERAPADPAEPFDTPPPPIDMELVTTEGCEKMWLAAVEQAFIDAKWDAPQPPPSARRSAENRWRRMARNRRSAMMFLAGDWSTFQIICTAARVNPAWVTRKANDLFRGNALWRRITTKGADNDGLTNPEPGGD